MTWFLEKFVAGLDPIYISGFSGTGKTMIIQKTLQKLVHEDTIQSIQMTFSS